MRINKDTREINMEFMKIRPGTAFMFEDKTYFKCEGDAAVDLVSGEIIRPANWNTCTIYPGATVQLGT